MKFSIERKLLLDCLSVGGSMSGKSKVLPILDCCKVNLVNNRVIISSYDGENAVLKGVSVINHDEDFSFCVNCSDFIKSIKSLRDAALDFELKDSILYIRHLKGYMELPYESSAEYPTVDNVNDGVCFSGLSAELYYGWLGTARNFSATDALRPILSGVHLYFSESEYGVCASDGNAMFTDKRFVESSMGNGSAVIPNGAISSVLAVLNGHDFVDIKINERNISFSCKDSKVVCRLPNGAFPNFKAVFPKSHSVDVRLSREDLLEAVNRAKLFSDNGTSLCILETLDGELGVAAENLDYNKKCIENCVASCDGKIRIGVKGDFIVKCLASSNSEGVVLEMSDPSRPIIIKFVEEPEMLVLLMPMQIR